MKRIILSVIIILSIITMIKNKISYGENIDSSLSPAISLINFTDGLDLDTATDKLQYTYSPNLYNIDLDENDTITTRKGILYSFSLPVSTNVKILSNFVANYDSGISEWFIQAGSIVFVTTNRIDFTTVVSGVSTIYPMSFELFNGRVFISNGVNDVGVWDTNTQTYTTYPFIPKGRYLLNDRSQLLVGGIFDSPSSVYFNDIESDGIDINDWSTDHFLACGAGDGQIITGMFKMDNKVYVTKERSIFGLLTEANYVDAEIIRYNDLYGSVSNNAINNWKSGKNILNKYGLYLYDGGLNWDFIGRNVSKNLTDKIGLLNTNNGRITQTTDSDFNTGTFQNCFSHNGTIYISTHSMTWNSNSTFNPAYSGSTQYQANNNSIFITTSSGSGYTKFPLTFYSQTSNIVQLPISGSAINISNIYDNDDKTGIALGITDNHSLQFVILSDLLNSGNTPMFIKRLRIKMQNAIFGTNTTSGTKLFYGDPAFWSSANINTFQIDTYNSAQDPESRNTFIMPNYSKASSDAQDLTYDVPDFSVDRSSPTRIQIGFYSAIRKQPFLGGIADLAPIIYDVSAFSYSPSVNYSSAVYISPIFNSGQQTTKYNFLTFNNYLGLASTGTINYFVRSSANSNMSSPTAWYQLWTSSVVNGITLSSATDSAIDEKQYFQFRSDLYTSSITFSPIINSVNLEYETTFYAYYRSRVFDEGGGVTAQGSFLAETEGSPVTRIRSSATIFSTADTSIPWTPITSGSNLGIPVGNRFIEYDYFTTTKSDKIKSVTMTWSKSGSSGGGNQDTPSTNYMDKYYLAYSTWADYNTDVLCFNKMGRFTRYDWDVSGFAVFNNLFYILSSTQPIVYQALVGTTDNGIPINFRYETPDMNFALSDNVKDLINTYVTGKQQTGSWVNLQTFLNYGTTPTDTRFCNLSSDSNFRLQLSTLTYSKNIRLVLTSSSTANVQLNNINMYLQRRDLY